MLEGGEFSHKLLRADRSIQRAKIFASMRSGFRAVLTYAFKSPNLQVFMHCHLIVPDLFWPEPSDTTAYDTVTSSALQLLLARGRRTIVDFHDEGLESFESWLLARCGVARQQDWPVAPFTAEADGLAVDPAAEPSYWLRADPIHLRVDRDRLIAAELDPSSVRMEEAEALVATLNQHFSVDGLRFDASNPARWYVRASAPARMQTASIATVQGQSVEACMPSGPDAQAWRSVMNQAQMLLHEHAVNQVRETRGELAINSIWFWGGGRLVQPALGERPVQWLADNALARGLALAAELPAKSVPNDATAWLRSAGQDGIVWIVLEQLRAPAARRDIEAWKGGLRSLEQKWFSPVLEALRDGRLGMVTLHAIGPASALGAESTAQDLRRFWRRPKPLAQYVAQASAP